MTQGKQERGDHANRSSYYGNAAAAAAATVIDVSSNSSPTNSTTDERRRSATATPTHRQMLASLASLDGLFSLADSPEEDGGHVFDQPQLRLAHPPRSVVAGNERHLQQQQRQQRQGSPSSANYRQERIRNILDEAIATATTEKCNHE